MSKITRKVNLLVAMCLIVCAIGIFLVGCSSAPAATTSNSNAIPTKMAVSSNQAVSPTADVAANATVSAVASVQSINPGGNFDVTVKVTTDVPTRQLQCSLKWDPTRSNVAR